MCTWIDVEELMTFSLFSVENLSAVEWWILPTLL